MSGADFVLIGGGIYGASVAWSLAAKGADVLVLEAQRVAAGASGGLGKRGVRANGRDARELPLARIATQIWPRLGEQLGADTGYERVGHLQLFERPDNLAFAERQSEAQNRLGIETRVLGHRELADLEPELSERVIGAVYCPIDGVADHTATTKAYARAAEARGARFLEGALVRAMDVQSSRVTSVRTGDGRRINVGNQVLLVANAGVKALVAAATGVELPLEEVLPQVMLTEPLESVPVHHLIGHMERRLAMKALPDQSVMISGGWLGRWNEALCRGETTPEAVERNREQAVAVYPALESAPIRSAAADRRESVGPELVPIIDRVPGLHNALFAAGWTGHGWAIAPAVCELLCGWLLGAERPELLAPFRLPASA